MNAPCAYSQYFPSTTIFPLKGLSHLYMFTLKDLFFSVKYLIHFFLHSLQFQKIDCNFVIVAESLFSIFICIIGTVLTTYIFLSLPLFVLLTFYFDQ